MTEEQWLACDDPGLMLRTLGSQVSRRQLLLFACACARGWEDPLARSAVALGEGIADGRIHERNWGAEFLPVRSYILARVQFNVGPDLLGELVTPGHIAVLASYVAALRAEVRPGPLHAALLRDVAGNPFQHPALPDAVRCSGGGIVARLALAIYEEQDYDLMPVLGDALEESGADIALVDHCHDEGPHVRGCWALDLILGKE